MPRTRPKHPPVMAGTQPNDAQQLLSGAAGLMLSGNQISRLRHAVALYRTPFEADSEQARRIVRQVEDELRIGIDESIALERARGGEVDRAPGGVIRMRSRDGLQSVYEGGHIDTALYDYALKLRAAYEARSSGLGSQMSANEVRAGHDNNQLVFAGVQRAKALQMLGNAERRVAVECADEPACLQMLRAVVGEGMSVSSFGEGRAYTRHLKALVRALETAKG